MALHSKPALDDESTFTDIERPRAPRPSMRPEIRPLAPRDDDATLVYSSGMKAAPLAPAKRDSVRPRTASMFPPPPADRPRVFEHPARVEEKSARTVLRPSVRPETTELRPVTYPPPPPRMATPAAFPVERPSLRAVTLEAPPAAVVAPRVTPYPRERMAFAAVAALFAPIVLAFAFLGPGDAVAAQATLMTPPVLAAAVMTTVDARPTSPTPVPVATVVAAPVTPPVPAAVEPAPSPAHAAQPAAPRFFAQRPAILTPPPSPRSAVAKAAPAAKSGLPDAEAASALARAQLEAALR